MTDEKLEEIFKALQGITYSEWTRISKIIDHSFDIRSLEQKSNLLIATPNELRKWKKRLHR